MKKNNHIIVLGILFLVMLSSIGGYIYLYTRIQNKFTSMESIVTEIANEKKSQENILGLRRSIVLTEQKNEILNSHFVTEDKVVDFIESIETLGRDSKVNVEITSIQPGDQIGKQGLYATLDISGDFNSLNTFILLLENMPHQMLLNRVTLTTEKGGSQTLDPKTGKVIPSNGLPVWRASVDLVLTSYRKE